MPALLALIAVTAVWGLTFVQVKDAVELYPLFAFLAVRFLIASVVLAVPARGRMGALGRPGWVAGASLGLLLALGYAFQTAGLERTTVSSAGFITGLYVVFTPLLGLLLFRTTVGRADSREHRQPGDRKCDADPDCAADLRPEEEQPEQGREDDVEAGDEARARDRRVLEPGRLQPVRGREERADSDPGDVSGSWQRAQRPPRERRERHRRDREPHREKREQWIKG